jgi:membrane protein DedA with SNARE-associated domain
MSAESLTSVILGYRYWILIPLSILEGPIVALATAALAARGYFNPYVVFCIFIVKDLVVDGGYYYVGRFAVAGQITSRWMAKAHVIPHAESLRPQWEHHAWRTTWIGKLSWGLGPAVLAIAGIVGVPASAFFTYASSVALVQYGVLFALGYTVGHAFTAVSAALRIVQVVVALSLVIAIIYTRRRFANIAGASHSVSLPHSTDGT